MKITWICLLVVAGYTLADDTTTTIMTMTEGTTTTTTTLAPGTPGLVDVVSGVGSPVTETPTTTTAAAQGRGLDRAHPHPKETPRHASTRKRPLGGGHFQPRDDEEPKPNVTVTILTTGTENRLEDLVGHHNESPVVNVTMLPMIPVVIAEEHPGVRNRRQIMTTGFGNGLGMGGLGGMGMGGLGGMGMGGFGGMGGIPVGGVGMTSVGTLGSPFMSGMGAGMMGGVRNPTVVDTVTVEDTIVPGKK